MPGSGIARFAYFRGLPLVIGVLAAALSIGGWAYLVADRRAQIERMASDVSAQSHRTVLTTVRARLNTFRNLAGFWAAVGKRPVGEWRADADLVIENDPSISYIAWIYPDGRRHRVAAGRDESPRAVEIEPGESRRAGAQPQIIGPSRDARGIPGMRILRPVRRGDSDLGVLEAHVDLQALLADALEESAPGYAIRILWDGEEIYRRGDPTRDRWQSWWRRERSVALPLGVAWTLEHAPTRELAATLLTPIPHYLLALGLLLAFALGLLAHYLRLSFLHARFLAAGNVALEESAGQLRRLNLTLEARVAERTEELEAFNHSISHDLKSPLGAILNFATILEADHEQELGDEGRDMLARIRSSALRATQLLEGLQRLSRAGHSALQSAEIDMDALARECFAQARLSAAVDDPNAALLARPLPRAQGDRSLVGEVLTNLFENALKYSQGREERRIEIEGRIERGEAHYEISDNGQGFDMQYADKLFGLFERLHGSRDVPGTGVGLALVERVVRRHGGRVWAEGKVGEGARFGFSLPPAETDS